MAATMDSSQSNLGLKPVRVGYKSSNSSDVWMSSSWLDSVLSRMELRDSKLAIVGILGDSNSGKSFLMNIMAEYLRFEEEESHGWMANVVSKRNPTGFFYHEENNCKQNENFYEGIYMWPRPFVLKKPGDGYAEEKVVVLLLDINMDLTTPGVETLMCLLCSSIIYNTMSSETPSISRILNLRKAILDCDTSFKNVQPKDLVFQHVTFVFRDFSSEDPKFKCGRDKALAYLSKVMQMENNISLKDEFEKIPSKDCFLLKKPDSCIGDQDWQLIFEDKRFMSQLKSLTEDILNIDDLALKSVKDVQINLNGFTIIQRMDFLIPGIVDNFYNLPHQEKQNDIEEQMETDKEGSQETPTDVQVLNEVATPDVKIHETSQNIPNDYHNCSRDFEKLKQDIGEKLDYELKIQIQNRRDQKKTSPPSFDDAAILNDVVFPRITNFYNQEMFVLTQNRMSNIELLEAHEKLKNGCFDSVKKSCLHNDYNYIPLQSESSFEEMERMLNKCFQFHSENNQINIGNAMARIQLLIIKCRNNYVDLMKNKILHHILSHEELEKVHKESLDEVSNLLKIELRLLDEDPKVHLNSLEAQINGNFDSFVEENFKRIKEEQERMERWEEKKREAMANVSLTNEGGTSVKMETENPSAVRNYLEIPQVSSGSAYQFASTESLPGASNSTIVSSERQQKPTALTIAVEFGMKTVKCGVMLDGQLTIIPDRWGNLEFPNNVAVTIQDEILVGHEVLNRAYDEMKCAFYLTDTLLTPSDKLESFPLILIRGESRKISKELLCGLILARIKADAEEFLKRSVEFIVITVPLWYTSSQRQATKDAAIIGGFSSVALINEPTAVALARANHQVRSTYTSSKYFLVVVANNDYRVDVAVYEYSQGRVNMVSCAGNLHHGEAGVLQEFRSWFKNQLLGEERKRFIRSLVKECVGKREMQEYILICDEEAALYDLQKIVHTSGRKIQNPNRSVAILTGAAIFAQLTNSDELIARSHISDKLPYRIDYTRSNIIGTGKICARHEIIPLTGLKLRCSFESIAQLELKILESGNVETFITAYLTVPVQLYTNAKRKIDINFHVNPEGILNVAANYADTKPKQEIQIFNNSFNLSHNEIVINASLLSSWLPNPKIQEGKRMLENSKNELRDLATFILNTMDQVQSLFGKDQLEKRAAEAIEALNIPNVTLKDINSKIDLLMKLKSKYLS